MKGAKGRKASQVPRRSISRIVTIQNDDGTTEEVIRRASVPGKARKGNPMVAVMQDQMAKVAGLPPRRDRGKDKGPPPKPRRNIPPGARR